MYTYIQCRVVIIADSFVCLEGEGAGLDEVVNCKGCV